MFHALAFLILTSASAANEGMGRQCINWTLEKLKAINPSKLESYQEIKAGGWKHGWKRVLYRDTKPEEQTYSFWKDLPPIDERGMNIWLPGKDAFYRYTPRQYKTFFRNLTSFKGVDPQGTLWSYRPWGKVYYHEGKPVIGWKPITLNRKPRSIPLPWLRVASGSDDVPRRRPQPYWGSIQFKDSNFWALGPKRPTFLMEMIASMAVITLIDIFVWDVSGNIYIPMEEGIDSAMSWVILGGTQEQLKKEAALHNAYAFDDLNERVEEGEVSEEKALEMVENRRKLLGHYAQLIRDLDQFGETPEQGYAIAAQLFTNGLRYYFAFQELQRKLYSQMGEAEAIAELKKVYAGPVDAVVDPKHLTYLDETGIPEEHLEEYRKRVKMMDQSIKGMNEFLGSSKLPIFISDYIRDQPGYRFAPDAPSQEEILSDPETMYGLFTRHYTVETYSSSFAEWIDPSYDPEDRTEESNDRRKEALEYFPLFREVTKIHKAFPDVLSVEKAAWWASQEQEVMGILHFLKAAKGQMNDDPANVTFVPLTLERYVLWALGRILSNTPDPTANLLQNHRKHFVEVCNTGELKKLPQEARFGLWWLIGSYERREWNEEHALMLTPQEAACGLVNENLYLKYNRVQPKPL